MIFSNSGAELNEASFTKSAINTNNEKAIHLIDHISISALASLKTHPGLEQEFVNRGLSIKDMLHGTDEENGGRNGGWRFNAIRAEHTMQQRLLGASNSIRH